jgi:hypothetical protein
MTDDLDRMDKELREYAERWRATLSQPALPSLHATGSGRRTRSSLVGFAAATAVTLVLVGVTLLGVRDADDAPPTTDQTPKPTTSTLAGTVPWAPLDPTHPDLPRSTIPASPDPAPAAAAAPCTAEDLRAASQLEAAAGTAVLYLTIRPATPEVSCHLQGHPEVQFLNHGQSVDIPAVDTTESYRDPALVARGNVATLSLYWGSNWCTDPVENDRIRLALESGWIEVDGYGHSPACNGTPGSGPNTVSIGSFQPQSYREAEVTSPYAQVDGQLTALSDPVPGQELRFLVTLTARQGDVPLDPCPEYSMAQYGHDDSVEARFSLNCPQVPHRNATGVPYLPHDVPVQFEMRWTLLGPDIDAPKAIWKLEAPGAPALAIPTRSDLR